MPASNKSCTSRKNTGRSNQGTLFFPGRSEKEEPGREACPRHQRFRVDHLLPVVLLWLPRWWREQPSNTKLSRVRRTSQHQLLCNGKSNSSQPINRRLGYL